MEVPPTPENSYYISKTRGTEPLCSWTGRSSITQEDFTQFGITSATGSITGSITRVSSVSKAPAGFHSSSRQSAAGTGRSDLRGPSRSRRLFASDDRPRLLASELASVGDGSTTPPVVHVGVDEEPRSCLGFGHALQLATELRRDARCGCAALASEGLSFCNFWISSARVRAPRLTASPASSTPHRRMRETELVRDQLIRVATFGEVVDSCLVNIVDSPSHCANGCNRHVP